MEIIAGQGKVTGKEGAWIFASLCRWWRRSAAIRIQDELVFLLIDTWIGTELHGPTQPAIAPSMAI
jgi:hypothetical protein